MRRGATGWTTAAWHCLCLLTLISAIAAITGPLWRLPPVWQGLAIVPGLLVTLLYAVACWADWSQQREGRCAHADD